jgi:hypothetical protein
MGEAPNYRKSRLGSASVWAERDDRDRISLRSTEESRPIRRGCPQAVRPG